MKKIMIMIALGLLIDLGITAQTCRLPEALQVRGRTCHARLFVRQKGQQSGPIVGEDGNYAITVPDNIQVLVFSFVGFKNTEVPMKEEPGSM